MRVSARCFLFLSLLVVPATTVVGQGMPTSQPPMLSVFVEELKAGMSADHEAHEAGWPAAFARAQSPSYYLAIESITGSPEVWYLVPNASFSAEAANMKSDNANSDLAAAQRTLTRDDAQYLEGTRAMHLMARPDLSFGAFPDLAQVRFFDITTIRIRLGHDQGWEQAAKKYMELAKRNAPGMSYRVYQVTAGMPGGTWLIFSSVNDYAGFDQMMANDRALWGGATPEEMAAMQKSVTDDFQFIMTNRYRVSPTMSYVAAETKAKAPDFWK